MPTHQRYCLPVLLALVTVLNAQGQTAEQILQKTKDTYVAMKTYSDSGTVIDEYGSAASPGKTRHSFTTNFRRSSPRAFVLDAKKEGGDRYVVWGDPDAFHTWWKTTGAQYDFPNPNNVGAISGSGRNTGGAGVKIPTLLYGKSQLAAMMLDLHDPTVEGKEKVSGHDCYRVTGRASDTYAATGKEVNIHKVTVWIDATSYLVRQVREEWKGLPGQVSRTTTDYEPQSDPPIDEAKLHFKAPEQ